MIIDFHSHIYPEKIADRGVRAVLDFYEFEHNHDGFGTLSHLKQSCASAGVTHRVLLGVSTKEDKVVSINRFVASCLDDTTFGFGCMHPDFVDPIAELEQFASLGLIGVKLHADMQACDIDDKRLYPIYDYAAQTGMPVYHHMGDPTRLYSSPKKLANVLDDFPTLTVIGAHFGGYARWDEAMDYLCGRKVYFDTSSSIAHADVALFKKIIDKHGTHQFLFGTDYPVTNHTDELKQFAKLSLSSAQQQAILYENGAALLRRLGVKL